MAVNPDSIPRYAPPAWADAEDDTPMGIMDRCNHQDACLRLLEMLNGPLPAAVNGFGREARSARASVAERLGCADCTEWEEA